MNESLKKKRGTEEGRGKKGGRETVKHFDGLRLCFTRFC